MESEKQRTICAASKPIGTDERWGARSISNALTQVVVYPQIAGTNYSGAVALQPGTQTVIAAISDVAGNVGFATNSATLSVVTNAQYLSDAAGCLTNMTYTGTHGFSSSVELQWDERYRLKNVDDASGFVGYGYDVLDRRISRSFVDATSPSHTNVEHYVYDGNQVVADLDESGDLLRTYVWGPGIDNLLSMTVYESDGDVASTNTYYALKNHQNSVIAFVDAAGGVVESYEYDAWGRTHVFSAAGVELSESAIGNRYGFQGREIDWTTGFYYFRARWYDPVTGRWLSKDPIGIEGGMNLYAFCGNNPVVYIDPDGLRNTRVAVGAALELTDSGNPFSYKSSLSPQEIAEGNAIAQKVNANNHYPEGTDVRIDPTKGEDYLPPAKEGSDWIEEGRKSEMPWDKRRWHKTRKTKKKKKCE